MTELLTSSGKRKYLTQDEQERFLKAASELNSAIVRTLCMTLAYTGCRISEALELTPEHIDVSAKAVRFRTLKQHGKEVYRLVPVPDNYLNAMKLVHTIQKSQRQKKNKTALLWPISRTMAWKHVKAA